MAIVKCKECGSDVSSKALTCPKCGVTLRKKWSGCATVTGAVLIGMMLLAVIGLFSQDYPTSTSGTTSTAASKPAAEDGSTEKSTRAQTLMLLVKRSLRNPDSLKVESVLVTDALAVCATYRAQNGFGGMNREQAVMNSAQTKVLSNSEKGFAALWNHECADKTGLETKYLFPH